MSGADPVVDTAWRSGTRQERCASIHRYLLHWAVALTLLCLPACTAATTLVLYPQTVGAAETIYRDILDGINNRLDATAVTRKLLPDTSRATLRAWLDTVQPSSVITLGRQATDAYVALEYAAPQIIGGLNISPQTRPEAIGVSLAVSPEAVFDILQQLLPALRHVYVVYNPEQSQWLIDQAQQAANTRGFTLTTTPASDLQTSAQVFNMLLPRINPADSGLWLLWDDRLIDTAVVLPAIITRAWARRLPLFSSVLAHVRHGALFSVYPNYRKLGERLSELARLAESTTLARPHIEPIRAVNRAINLRSASRLDIDIKQSTLRQFEVIYGR